MNVRFTHTYPFLFAVLPVLRIPAAYPGWEELGDVVVVLATVLMACGLLYGLVRLVTGRGHRRLVPLFVMAGVLLFWVYPRVAGRVEHRIGLSHAILLPLWLAASAGAIWWLVRRPARLERAETFLTLTSGLLTAWFAVTIVVAQLRSGRALRESAVVQRLAAPIRPKPGAVQPPNRDIYLIVLDEYANAEVTSRVFGFDNRTFLDSLRQLGFVVPEVHSNYLHTFLSLPSMLNSAQVAGLSSDVGRKSIDRTLPDYLVEHNRIVPFVKSRGYQFAFFPSLSWEATRHNTQADVEFHAWPGFNAAREITRSSMRQVLNETSLLRYIDWGGAQLARRHIIRTLEAVAQVPRMTGPPVFTFAHVMSPHTPYIFDRDCGPARERTAGTRSQRRALAYVEQVQCLDRMVLELVTTLIRTSDVPPVILLQGDHGSKSLHFDQAGSAEKIPVPAAKERLGAFGAYYLPPPGRDAFGDSVTVVNVMGNVLRTYLGADLPREPDDMYLSVHKAPYTFRQVDFAWLGKEDWSLDSR
ncbi:MAG: sulfatase-like hydrolase/transferase [Gemmatimonadales bacterium]